MGNEDSDDISFFPFEAGDVWNDVVYPGHVFFRHAESHVNNEDASLIVDEHHVSTNLA